MVDILTVLANLCIIDKDWVRMMLFINQNSNHLVINHLVRKKDDLQNKRLD